MLKSGIPVVFAYIADAHDNQEGASLSAEKTFGPGEAPYVKQLGDYNAAFGKFFADLKAVGIDQSNTLFIFTPDEGDHFVGGAPTPANCDGAKIVHGDCSARCAVHLSELAPRRRRTRHQSDLDLRKLPGTRRTYSIHFDDSATTYVNGQPLRTARASACSKELWPASARSIRTTLGQPGREPAWNGIGTGSPGSNRRSGRAKADPHEYSGGSQSRADFHFLRQSQFLLRDLGGALPRLSGRALRGITATFSRRSRAPSSVLWVPA